MSAEEKASPENNNNVPVNLSKIMLDNWTLTTAFLQLTNDIEQYQLESSKLSMANLLMGIVLWDEIQLPSDSSSTTSLITELRKNDATIKLADLCKPIDIPKFEAILPYVSPKEHEDWLLNFNTQNLNTILERTKLYLDYCYKHSVNYLPHPQRAEYLIENNLIKKGLNRYTIEEKLDKALLDYYAELNKEYNNNFLSFNYPVIYDYIRSQANTPIDELSVALDLRENKDVIAYRQSLNSLDVELNRGNRIARLAALKQINELTESISNDSSKSKKSIIGIQPLKVGISLPFNLGVDVEFPITIKAKARIPEKLSTDDRILNLTFLTSLRDFGMGKKSDT